MHVKGTKFLSDSQPSWPRKVKHLHFYGGFRKAVITSSKKCSHESVDHTSPFNQPNHFNRYLEVAEKNWSVLKAAEWFIIARGVLKPVSYLSASNDHLNGFCLFNRQNYRFFYPCRIRLIFCRQAFFITFFLYTFTSFQFRFWCQ